jgi:proteic killer suppression protein
MAFEVRFKDESLEELQREDAKRDKAYPPGIGKAFRKRMQMAVRKRMQFIRGAGDERDFYALRSFRFEKLQGKREHQCSMRLNDQWRLILEMECDNPKKIIWIVAIEDYH